MSTTQQEDEHAILAAIDLGSNSFHMIIARLRDGHFQVMDRLREMVQLRAGIDRRGNLNKVSQQRAIACLERFGERIRDLPEGSVRVVGTNTLRVAKNSQEFLRKARKALGHPIEVVAGEEEARLIYLGVSHALAFDNSRRLVMDIGGGSTEFIIGEGDFWIERESLSMGCVSFSQRYFPDGVISQTMMKKAVIAASSELRAIQQPYRKAGWAEAVGASGTIRCAANIIKEQGWAEDGVITPQALDNLVNAITSVSHISELNLTGLSAERASVLPGGVAVLKASFDRLRIDRMIVSDGALREGLLYDLLGRIQHDDERDRTVLAFGRRYQIDEKQADHVITMADQFFEQVRKSCELDDENKAQLSWAGRLHEVGLSISHDQFHKHSFYLLANSSLPGFSREEQLILALLVLGQRKKFPQKHFKVLPKELRRPTKYLTILLRLAMVFNRGRSEEVDTIPELSVKGKVINLTLPPAWLEQHPLTGADLQKEADYLSRIDYQLIIS